MKPKQPHNSMRGQFAYELYDYMLEDPNIWVVTGGLGYGMFDSIRADFPERFIDAGAAEMSMMAIGIGLAMQGKIPIVYSITPFLLWRPAELMRLYLENENIPVHLVGSGRDEDYTVHDGFTHDAKDASMFLSMFTKIKSYFPEDKTGLNKVMDDVIYSQSPTFLSLKRTW